MEHRSSTRDLHLPLSLASLSSWFQLVPVCFTSASVDLLHVVFGLPRFLLPWGVHRRAYLVTLAKGRSHSFRMRWAVFLMTGIQKSFSCAQANLTRLRPSCFAQAENCDVVSSRLCGNLRCLPSLEHGPNMPCSDVSNCPGWEKILHCSFHSVCHTQSLWAAFLSQNTSWWIHSRWTVSVAVTVFTGCGYWPHAQPSSFTRAWDQQGTGLNRFPGGLKTCSC